MNQKKILYIINNLLNGGAERLVLDVVPRLLKEKITCDVLLLSVIDNNNNMVKQLTDKGVNVLSLQSNNIYSPSNIFKLKKYISEYDIIHTHLFPTQYWVAFCKVIFCFNSKIFITTEHNTYNRRRDISIFKYIDKYVYSKYDKIISISESTQKNLIKYLPYLKDRLVLVNNGVDLSRFNMQSDFSNSVDISLPQDKKVLCQIAGFRKQKDQDTLIRSLTLLPQEYVAVFAGDGERMDECKKLVIELELGNRVFFLGSISNIPNLILRSYIVVISSHWEGFGLAAVEGMAARKPVIASDVEGLSLVVKGAGLLFSEGNHEELASIILSLDGNKQLYDEVADLCFERSKRFSIEKMVHKLVQLYKQ